jgi:hypothetical protein
MFGIAAVVAFVVAFLMHCFGWGSGKVDVDFFVILGLVFLAMHSCGWWPAGSAPWRRQQQ